MTTRDDRNERQRRYRRIHGRKDKSRPEYQKTWREAHPQERREYAQEWQPKGINERGLPSLTPVDVRMIRRRLVQGVSRKALALEHGVSYNTIRRIDDDVTYTAPEYYDTHNDTYQDEYPHEVFDI